MSDNDAPKRGFARMAKARRTELATQGGHAVPSDKRSFAQSPELARAASLKGVAARKAKRDAGG